jgi:threonine dehydratase
VQDDARVFSVRRRDDLDPRELGGLEVSAVRAAAVRLAGLVVRTPVVRHPALDAIAGCELWLKAENLQRIGAFKARGALHAASRLAPAQRERGLITYSSGNHAQAVALAAAHFGVRATIAMPTDAPKVKLAGVRALGAEIVLAGTTSSDRYTAALEIEAKTGGVIIPPYDDPHIIAGQGTATLELLEEVHAQTGGTLDALLVPVGGGGLVAGACLAAAPDRIAVHTVEPVGCDAMARSLSAGQRVAVAPAPTLADGLKPVEVGALNFAIAQHHVQGCMRVDDGELAVAMVTLLLHAKLLVEPSGAAALAAALRGGIPGTPGRVGVILSGGNVEPSLVARLLGEVQPLMPEPR